MAVERRRRVGWTGIVALALTLAAAPAAVALDPARTLQQYVHEVWEVDRGLPQNSVLDVVQSADGYLWLATFEGLVRFDGVRFEVFDKVSVAAIADNSVWAVLEDRRGRLWAGTSGGGLVVREGGRFRAVTTADGLPSDFVTALAEDGAGTLWVGTRHGVAYPVGDRFEAVAGLTASVRTLAADHDGALWVGTDGSGLFRVAGGVVTAFGAADGLPSDNVRALYVDPLDGTLWVGTSAAGVLRFDGQRLVAVATSGAPITDVRALLRDRHGSLWVGTGRLGLVRLVGDHAESFDARDGLTDDTVEALAEDAEGSLWIGTYRGGLNRLRDGKLVTLTTRQGLSHDQVRAVFADSRGDLWLGTVGGGADRLAGGTVVEVVSTARGLSSDLVWAITEGRDGSLWLGTYGGGLNRWRAGEVTVLTTADGLSDDVVRAVMEDRAGNLWIGTSAAGVDILRPDGRLDHLTSANGLPNDPVYALLEDTTGAIWLGTYGGGVARVVGDTITTLSTADGLSHDFAWTLSEDADQPGVVWIGTNGGGLNRYQDGRLSAYTQRQGLANDVVFQIVDDGAGRLWVGSQKGIFSVAKRDLAELDRGRDERLRCVVFDHTDGMRAWGCNGPSSPAGAKDRRGRLWFPTVNGVAVVDPANLPTNTVVPPVVIERFVVDGRELDPTVEAVLPPGSERLELAFTALSLVAPDKVRFRFRLEGLEERWTEASDRRGAQYQRLPPGRYVFRVLAANNDGIWNETGAALAFTLLPYFHQTRLFAVLVVAAVFALGAGVVAVRVRGLKARERELRQVVETRTRELADANAELTRLANQDGLTGIANHRYLDVFLEKEWRRNRREQKPLAAVMLDVDFFKKFNDRYGHQAGDDCLRRVAAVLDRCARRATDLAGRYGGEEFVLALGETGEEGARAVAERARLEVEALGVAHLDGGDGQVVTVSCGVAVLPTAADDDVAELLRRADAALYRAKRGGRNRVELWQEQAPASAPADEQGRIDR